MSAPERTSTPRAATASPAAPPSHRCSLPSRYQALLLLLLASLLFGCQSLVAVAKQPASASSSVPPLLPPGSPWTLERKAAMAAMVREMSMHAYGSYMRHAFPHDELKPLSKGWTDSLAELGNAHETAPARGSIPPMSSAAINAARSKGQAYIDRSKPYRGMALTLIDSLSTLAVLEEREHFCAGIAWLERHLSFDVDLRVHVFETNIRILGGLLSAHLLATDPERGPALTKDVWFVPLDAARRGSTTKELFEYKGGLLRLAKDLGERMLRAFPPPAGQASSSSDPSGDSPLPYAFVHLQAGVLPGESESTCAAGAGTLLLEFGVLSALTGDDRFFHAADRAFDSLWGMRHPVTGLIPSTFDRRGNPLDVVTGIGAGVDSFYEYMFKSYMLLDSKKHLDMFEQSVTSIDRHLKLNVVFEGNATQYYNDTHPVHRHNSGGRTSAQKRHLHPIAPASMQMCDAQVTQDWFVDSHAHSGAHVHYQFQSLQSFWPGVLVQSGRVDSARHLFASFYSVWERYSSLPERWFFVGGMVHPSERSYPLRPELAESAYLLHRATGDEMYLDAVERMVRDINTFTRTEGGFAGIADCEPGGNRAGAGAGAGGDGSRKKKLDDRMHSFFLAETLKYLYLPFADADVAVRTKAGAGAGAGASEATTHWMHRQPGPATTAAAAPPAGRKASAAPASAPPPPRVSEWMFSTEGHLFPIRSDIHSRFSDDRWVYEVVRAAPVGASPADRSAGATPDELAAWDAKRRFDRRVREVGAPVAMEELSRAAPEENQLLKEVLSSAAVLGLGNHGATRLPIERVVPHRLTHLFRFREGFFHPALVSHAADPALYDRTLRYYHARLVGEEVARGGSKDPALPPPVAPPHTPYTGGFVRSESLHPISVRDALILPRAVTAQTVVGGLASSSLNAMQCPVHSHSRILHSGNRPAPANFHSYDADFVRWQLKKLMDTQRVLAYEQWKMARTTRLLKKLAEAIPQAQAQGKGQKPSADPATKSASVPAGTGGGAAGASHSATPVSGGAAASSSSSSSSAGSPHIALPPEVLHFLSQQSQSRDPSALADPHAAPPSPGHAEDPPPPSQSEGFKSVLVGDFRVDAEPGTFHIVHRPTGGVLTIRNLATDLLELVNEQPEPETMEHYRASATMQASTNSHTQFGATADEEEDEQSLRRRQHPTLRPSRQAMLTVDGEEGYVHALTVEVDLATCPGRFGAAGGHFGTALPPARDTRRDSAQLRAALREGSLDGQDILRKLGQARRAEEGVLASVLVLPPPSDPELCEALSPAAALPLRGHIVLVQRGGCTFMQKALHLSRAGALGMLVWNRADPNYLFQMGGDGSGREGEVAFPALMVDEAAGAHITRCMAQMEEALKQKQQGQGQGHGASELRARLPVTFRRATIEPGTPVAVPHMPLPLPDASASASTRATLSAAAAAAASLPPPAPMHVQFTGTADHFVFTTMGGWSAEVRWNEEQQNYQLGLR